MATVKLGKSFALALCEALNIPHTGVLDGVTLNTSRDSIFSANFTIALTADDIIKAEMIMKESK